MAQRYPFPIKHYLCSKINKREQRRKTTTRQWTLPIRAGRVPAYEKEYYPTVKSNCREKNRISSQTKKHEKSNNRHRFL